MNKPVQSIGQSMNKIYHKSNSHIDHPIANKLSRVEHSLNSYTPHIKMKNSGRNYILITSSILIAAVILFLVIFAIYYYKESCKKVSFGTYLGGFDVTKSPCKKKEEPVLKLDTDHKKEVYHIGNQIYTYQQADCKCKSYGGKLATRNDIVEAYNKGANWCSYGWSEGGKAFYPTQKCQWDKLQKTKNKEKCGNPGVNGGKFPKHIRFGVNCFGYKPKGKLVHEKKAVCKNVEDANKPFCKQNDNKDIVGINPTDELVDFNNDKWSLYDN